MGKDVCLGVNTRFGQVSYVLTDYVTNHLFVSGEHLDDGWALPFDLERPEQVPPRRLELLPTRPPSVERRDGAPTAIDEERPERTWRSTGVGRGLEHVAQPRDVASRRLPDAPNSGKSRDGLEESPSVDGLHRC